MKISISIFNNRIAPVFDVASQTLLVDLKHEGEFESEPMDLPKESAELKVLKLAEQGVQILICGAISKPTLLLAQSQGLKILSFVSGEVDMVLQGFLDNCLYEDKFRMPGCRLRRQHRHRHGGHKHGKDTGWPR
jgi:predicted Fe-Mo cluster-binding NifX family protein